MPGHVASCPYQHRPPRGCIVCASERKGRPDPNETPIPPTSPASTGPEPLTACPHCYAPTVAGEPHTCLY